VVKKMALLAEAYQQSALGFAVRVHLRWAEVALVQAQLSAEVLEVVVRMPAQPVVVVLGFLARYFEVALVQAQLSAEVPETS